MMDQRSLGFGIALIGVLGTLLAVFADPLGIGEGEVFGWLQITGTIIGIVVTLIGVAIAMEWVPYPGRRADTAATGGQNTTIVTDTTPPDRTSEP